jgi:glycylpeptide N-tetradecanoyltransferase
MNSFQDTTSKTTKQPSASNTLPPSSNGTQRPFYFIDTRALLTPDYKPAWHVGLRATHTERRRLCAFISGIPVTLRVRDKSIKTVEINFLCIHKKLRGKYLAPILIKEITRRCHELGVWEAVYTGGVVLPKPVATCRYFHRPLDWIKLYETGFSPLPPGSTKERMVLRNRVPEVAKVRGVRLMEERDVAAVTGLLGLYLQKFDLAPEYSEEEVVQVTPPIPGCSDP